MCPVNLVLLQVYGHASTIFMIAVTQARLALCCPLFLLTLRFAVILSTSRGPNVDSGHNTVSDAV